VKITLRQFNKFHSKTQNCKPGLHNRQNKGHQMMPLVNRQSEPGQPVPWTPGASKTALIGQRLELLLQRIDALLLIQRIKRQFLDLLQQRQLHIGHIQTCIAYLSR